MLMYLYGPDAYARTTALNEKIVVPYQAKYPDAGVIRLYLDEEDAFSKLQEYIGGTSLFAKAKLVILYEPGKAEEKDLALLLKNLVDDKVTTVVVVAEKKLNKAFDFLLKEPVKSYAFEPMKGAAFVTFLRREAQKEELKISDDAIKQVAALYDGDAWAAITELRSVAHGSELQRASQTPAFFPMMQSLRSQSQFSRRSGLPKARRKRKVPWKASPRRICGMLGNWPARFTSG